MPSQACDRAGAAPCRARDAGDIDRRRSSRGDDARGPRIRTSRPASTPAGQDLSLNQPRRGHRSRVLRGWVTARAEILPGFAADGHTRGMGKPRAGDGRVGRQEGLRVGAGLAGLVAVGEDRGARGRGVPRGRAALCRRGEGGGAGLRCRRYRGRGRRARRPATPRPRSGCRARSATRTADRSMPPKRSGWRRSSRRRGPCSTGSPPRRPRSCARDRAAAAGTGRRSSGT